LKTGDTPLDAFDKPVVRGDLDVQLGGEPTPKCSSFVIQRTSPSDDD